MGLLFAKDAPGNLDPLTKALMAGKIGNMPVAPKYESAGENLSIKVLILIILFYIPYDYGGITPWPT